MTKAEVLNRIREIGIVPVVRARSADEARAACEAVAAGGIPIVEITMTVPGAVQVIARLGSEFKDQVLIGAGTVLDPDAARECIAAGAQFLVSPGLDISTIEAAKTKGVLMMAGALTPTEVITAWKAGSDVVKIFPCGNVGGPKYIKALKGPLPQIPMVPTGGINLQTAGEFLNAGAEALGVGGELINAEALRARKFSVITDLAKQFVQIVRTRRAISAQVAGVTA
ncbi:MAG TPA: bifunctional 4-hydroxy-2-oxoglutarate aldolase/2-dehydro-3-deoxy-phosphogluconate aldolase [Clostridia bacterium]|nr:bifunctional 4-hydroxy-2-oxoglutarate aldolase/2-dehydro-3-deoxy-phosphogluconate aldolase [Clostridia bacterium]